MLVIFVFSLAAQQMALMHAHAQLTLSSTAEVHVSTQNRHNMGPSFTRVPVVYLAAIWWSFICSASLGSVASPSHTRVTTSSKDANLQATASETRSSDHFSAKHTPTNTARRTCTTMLTNRPANSNRFEERLTPGRPSNSVASQIDARNRYQLPTVSASSKHDADPTPELLCAHRMDPSCAAAVLPGFCFLGDWAVRLSFPCNSDSQSLT
mmetsp:Transcript_14108/g.38402  ORF Transcript_14108/g.38402 Transcript_14108/m.38402 type:complete len:210 (+) Transcript_14108:99-728(+)